MTPQPASLIINSPFERPTHHWVRKTDIRLELIEGRRPAGYEVFDTRHHMVRGVELPLVNCIRERVDPLRNADYPGVAAEFKQGIAIPGDGGGWERLCTKMATGTGKTTVMAMIMAATQARSRKGLPFSLP